VTARKGWLPAFGLVAVTIALEVLFPDLEHAEFVWHRIPGFDFLYGMGGCAFIALGAKWIGKVFLEKPESYYEDER
jgi:hypothetical protein